MLKHILASSAIATLLATGAYAQTDPAADPAQDPAAPIVEGADDAPAMTEGADPAAPDATTTPEVVEDEPLAPETGTADTMDPAMEPETGAADATDPAMDAETGAADATDPATDPATGAADATDPAAVPAEDTADTMDPAADPAADSTVAGDWGPLDASTISTDQLVGADIVTGDNETIASIEDVLITEDGQVESIVARFGGFLGFGADRVLLTPDEVEVMQDESGAMMVRTSLTPESIEGRPVYEDEMGAEGMEADG